MEDLDKMAREATTVAEITSACDVLTLKIGEVEEGKDGTYIKLRLRWLSDCYTIYLRNSEIIIAQHDEALAPFYARLKEIVAATGVDCDVDNSRVVVDSSFEVGDDEDVEFDQAPLFY